MLFPSVSFLVFFLILLAVLLGVKQTPKRKILLLVASYIFYMWWNPAFILLIVFSTVVDFVIGTQLDKRKDDRQRRLLLILSLCTNLGLLAFFKYAGFFQENLLSIFRALGGEPSWTQLNILLPVGISFYTFQTMSYSIDVYRRKLGVCRSPLDFALFVSFFPQLVAGPIVRASDFLPQLERDIKLYFDQATFFLILRGLVKKIIIADNLSIFVDNIFSDPAQWPSFIIWMAAIAFAIQIYCDFSGYSDMAIGIAKIIGFDLPLNFNRPYFAKNPSDFWQRWHITLSSWLRDYLYIPLGGNRGTTWMVYRNLFLTMVLGGLWHGASWNFVLWGVIHGAALILYRLVDEWGGLKGVKMPAFLSILIWQYFVLLAWIPFRIVDTGMMLTAVRKFILFDFDFQVANIGLGGVAFFSTALIILGFTIVHILSYFIDGLDNRLAQAPLWVSATASVVIGILLVWLWPTQETPFIYFQF